ncbi:MAG TPA: hypothetical protein DEF30_05780 [Proteiniclasticum sp.]|uniref:hypothetical protein n=1 Tax=Proteiniclasticum sp. TaxID=2053595 RepID=UPI000E9013DD|nr:hypothetical protein [Proteiniclasticum sp.]HBW13310.1 hypothetical protein [Proteiniclasticum sp.]
MFERRINFNCIINGVWLIPIIVLTGLLILQNMNDLATILFFAGFSLVIISKWKANIGIKLLLILSILFRFIYAYKIFGMETYLFPDSKYYVSTLIWINDLETLTFDSIAGAAGTVHIGYNLLSFVTYRIFGSLYSLFAVNILMFAISVILFHEHLTKRFNIKIANSIAFLMTVSMNLFIFTSHILKDSMVMMLTVLSLHIYDKYKEKKSKMLIVSLIFVISLLVTTRIYAGFGILAGIVLDYILNNSSSYEEKKRVFKKLMVVSIALLAGFIILNDNQYYTMSMRYIRNVNFSFNTIAAMGVYLLSFLFSPLPWNMLNDVTVYTPIVLDSIFMIIFSPLFILFLYKLLRNKLMMKKFYIYIIPTVFHIFALSTSLETGAIRQRIGVFPFLLLMYMSGIFLKRTNNN